MSKFTKDWWRTARLGTPDVGVREPKELSVPSELAFCQEVSRDANGIKLGSDECYEESKSTWGQGGSAVLWVIGKSLSRGSVWVETWMIGSGQSCEDQGRSR